MDQETRQFILRHRSDDIHQLALRYHGNESVDMELAIQQIAGWQKARLKLPRWAACQDIIYPPAVAMEQCSSQATALYKAAVCGKLTAGTGDASLIDITGGYGVDFTYMMAAFGSGTYIERQADLCKTARHNMDALGIANVTVMNGDSTQLLPKLHTATMVYADPARRDKVGNRTYAIADCSPDMTQCLVPCMHKARYVMVKLSPMLDWHKAVDDLDKAWGSRVVSQVHIVATGNECKELLIVMQHQPGPLTVTCANDDQVFEFKPGQDSGLVATADPRPGMYLYEPNAAIMKAGCFDVLTARCGMRAIAQNSHLLLSDALDPGFPGRTLLIDEIAPLSKKKLQPVLQHIRRANIAVRNFKLSAAELRKRLRLADGGDVYIFGTTTQGGDQCLLFCHKVG